MRGHGGYIDAKGVPRLNILEVQKLIRSMPKVVIAVVPGSTLDHVIFFADDGTAYTMRINEVPASSGRAM